MQYVGKMAIGGFSYSIHCI